MRAKKKWPQQLFERHYRPLLIRNNSVDLFPPYFAKTFPKYFPHYFLFTIRFEHPRYAPKKDRNPKKQQKVREMEQSILSFQDIPEPLLQVTSIPLSPPPEPILQVTTQ
jgi:hypothetical protein